MLICLVCCGVVYSVIGCVGDVISAVVLSRTFKRIQPTIPSTPTIITIKIINILVNFSIPASKKKFVLYILNLCTFHYYLTSNSVNLNMPVGTGIITIMNDNPVVR